MCEVFYGYFMYEFHELFDFSWGYFDRAPSDCMWIAPQTNPNANLIIINLDL